MRQLHQQCIAALVWAISFAASAAVNDIYPTDFVALPAGSVNVTIYSTHQKTRGPYTDGIRTVAGEASVNQLALRASRIFPAGENQQYAWTPVAVLSYADVNTNTDLDARLAKNICGMGDLRLGSAFWFHIDRANRTYGLVSLLVSFPTADYNTSRTLNIAENRMRYVLSAGWMQPIGGKWLIDISPEVAVYGEDDRYLGTQVRTQDTSYALTSYLRYRQSDVLQFYGGAQINRGGATQVGGVEITGAPNNTRMYLGSLFFTSPKQQWQLRYSRDVQIDNGLRSEGEVSLRYLFSFD
jgi:Putative MetA-pathway of phenol degradation